MKTTKNTVLITGGSAGIGLALAKRFWQAGNDVIIIGRNQEKLAAAQEMLQGIRAEAVDISDPTALSQIVKRHPDVNILINNAGVQFNYAFTEEAATFAKIGTEIDTNLVAPINLAHLFIPQFLNMEDAAIINVSSGLGIVPKESASVYCATKAAIHSFSKSLRWQLEETSIKVFEIIPPIVETAMTAGRGNGKITPEELVDEFWRGFKRDQYEMQIGRAKLLMHLNRFLPPVAERIMRRGL